MHPRPCFPSGFLACAAFLLVLPLAPRAGRAQPPRRPARPQPAASRPELVLQAGHGDSVNAVTVSPDGQTVASGSYDGTIKIWDARTGNEQRTLRAQGAGGDTVYSLAFAPNGQTLAGGYYGGAVRLWNVRTGAQTRTLPGPARGGDVGLVAFSPDGQTLASAVRSAGQNDPTIFLWNARTGAPRQTLRGGHAADVASLAFAPIGTTLASGDENGRVVLWNLASGQHRPMRAANDENTGVIGTLAFSPDGTLLAGTGRAYDRSPGRTVTLWRAATGAPIRTLTAPGSVWAAAFSPDGKTLATGGPAPNTASNADIASGGAVQFWSAGTGARLRTLETPGAITSLAFVPGAKTLAGGSTDRSVSFWNLAGAGVRRRPGHATFAGRLAFSPDGRLLATGASDDTVSVWNAQNVGLRHVLPVAPAASRPTGWPYLLAFSPNSKTLAAGAPGESGAGLVHLWNAQTGALQGRLSGFAEPVAAIAFAPNSSALACTVRVSAPKRPESPSLPRGVIQVWDVAADAGSNSGDRADAAAAPAARQQLGFFDSIVEGLVYFPDGRTLAGGSRDGTARVFDAQTGALQQTFKAPNGYVWALAVSPNGKTLAGSDLGKNGAGLVALWDVPAGRLQRTLSGHARPVTGLAFSPNGNTLATSSYDGTVRVWDTRTGALRQTLGGESGNNGFRGVAYAPSGGGGVIAANGEDAIQFWSAHNGRRRLTLQLLPGGAWIAFTPEGYYDGSAGVARYLGWRGRDGRLLSGKAAQAAARAFHRPDRVRSALTP